MKIITLLTLFTLVSCNEFLSPNGQSEGYTMVPEELPLEGDGGQEGGGSVQGGNVQGGNVQGGSAQGGYVQGGYAQGGYAQGGYAQGGSAQGGFVGGTAGGSAEGGYVGGTAGGSAEGGYVGGNVGGAAQGGYVGGTVGGSAEGGYVGGTAGGSVEGGATGGTNGQYSENFIQTDTKDLDILWVIDNSGSMKDEQTALADNFHAFASAFVGKDVVFTMNITTTDFSVVPGTGVLSSSAAKNNPTQFIDDFKRLVQVGTSGSGYEQGLYSAENFVQNYLSNRRDTYLAVVILTDEEDSSPQSASHYVNRIKASKRNAGLVKIYSICDVENTNTEKDVYVGCLKDTEASNSTNGVVYNIRNSFGGALASLGDGLVSLTDSFALAKRPLPGTLKVFVDNVLVPESHYDYDDNLVSIKFRPGHIPAMGASIRVEYTSY